jgi:ferredoxin-nitrite reductase
LICDLPADRTAEVGRAIEALGLGWSATGFRTGLVACTGNAGCKYAAANTKAHALEIAAHLESALGTIEPPVNIHLTGCPHSCAQHYIGDIGLMGVKVSGEEGYQVVLGGGADTDEGLARELIPAIRFSELTPILHNLFAAFTAQHTPGESFLNFTRRHTIDELRDLCQLEPAR